VPESVRPSFSNVRFFEERMDGHSKVKSVEKPAPQVYVIERRGMGPVKIFLTNSYVVGLDEYFEVLGNHPDLDALVTIGPYNSVATAAKHQGIDDGVGVFQFKEFMGALHREGNDFVCYPPRGSS
jgi:hypothetical protein